MKYSVLDICTGKSYPAELVKETKCYYTVSAETIPGKKIHHRFHKKTMHIDWQHLTLRIRNA